MRSFVKPYQAIEQFLHSLLHKLQTQWRYAQDFFTAAKPYKIVAIKEINALPGASKFVIQLKGKHNLMVVTAAEIILQKLPLNQFSVFHRKLIIAAAGGQLHHIIQQEFTNHVPKLKLSTKTYNRVAKQYIYSLAIDDEHNVDYTAAQISADKQLLAQLSPEDIYDVAFTQGADSILSEEQFFTNNSKV